MLIHTFMNMDKYMEFKYRSTSPIKYSDENWIHYLYFYVQIIVCEHLWKFISLRMPLGKW